CAARRRRADAALSDRADDACRPAGRAAGQDRGGRRLGRRTRRSSRARGACPRGAAQRARPRGGDRDRRRADAPAQRRQGDPGPGRAEEMKPRARRSLHARYTPAGQDGIGHLELTRPEKLKATDADSVGDLDRAATRAARDRKARAIIVRGRGRAFCTGIDLSALAGDRLGGDWFRRWDVALAKIESIPVATIAAIQGPCLGGGLQITLCCDLRVASEEATFGLSAVRHGIIPGLATYRLPRLIGMGVAREMMLVGETWDAARAHRQGLVHRVAPSDPLAATALQLAQQLATY